MKHRTTEAILSTISHHPYEPPLIVIVLERTADQSTDFPTMDRGDRGSLRMLHTIAHTAAGFIRTALSYVLTMATMMHSGAIRKPIRYDAALHNNERKQRNGVAPGCPSKRINK